MNNSKYLALLILPFILLMVISCSKEKMAMNEDLNTTWKWVSTDGGIANNIHETPATTGKNIDLRMTKGNKYFIYTDGVITSQGTYILETRNCIHDQKEKQVINFSSAGDKDMMIENLTYSVLDLSDENYDGVGSLYSRK